VPRVLSTQISGEAGFSVLSGPTVQAVGFSKFVGNSSGTVLKPEARTPTHVEAVGLSGWRPRRGKLLEGSASMSLDDSKLWLCEIKLVAAVW